MAEVEWQGHSYLVPPIEPAQQRGLELCHPSFAAAITRWLEAANAHLASEERYTVFIGETRRSLERQVYLYSIGRVTRRDERVRSNTLDSRHRWGLAADLYAKDGLLGGLVWHAGWWSALYAAVPPQTFGLTDIRPFEWVHLELIEADAMIARAGDFDLEQT